MTNYDDNKEYLVSGRDRLGGVRTGKEIKDFVAGLHQSYSVDTPSEEEIVEFLKVNGFNIKEWDRAEKDLSDEEIVSLGGGTCKHCGSGEVDPQPTKMGEGFISRKLICEDCKKETVEYYKLDGTMEV